MEDVLDKIAAYLSGYSTADPGLHASDVTWIVGDVGMSDPENLPFGFIIPLNDQVATYSANGLPGGVHGVDKDQFTIPMLIVHAQHQYAAPVVNTSPTQSGSPFLEQPSYRDLLRLGQNVRKAFRANITLDGLITTSRVSELRYVLAVIDAKEYRAVRLTLEVAQRRQR